MKPKHIIFFDGSCGLCHKSVQFVLNFDKKKKFYFSPLNSSYSNKALINVNKSIDTFYLQSNGVVYQKSVAWLKVLFILGGVWKLISIFLNKLPTALLDKGYDLIAKFRKQIFGVKNNCNLLSKDQKDRFLF